MAPRRTEGPGRSAKRAPRTPATLARRSSARPTTAAGAAGITPDLAARLRRLSRTLRSQLSRAQLLSAIVREANETLDPRRIADRLVARSAEWLPMAAWAVLVDELTGRPRLLASRGLTRRNRVGAAFAARQVFRAGTDWSSPNVRAEASEAPPAACLALALSTRGRTRVALVGVDDRPAVEAPGLTPATRALLAMGIDPLAYALDSALRLERAEALSVTDDLTRLYNSRFLALVLRRECKRAVRSGGPLSLLFIDLDGFKEINDTWGHLTGSRALVEAAAVLRGSARETDMVARFGGDEFAVVLPDTGAAGARMVAERIRDRIAGHAFLEREGLHVRLTASVGIAALRGSEASAEQLLRAADEAMYWIKERGKNGIHVATSVSE